jgi:hypothetical protein
MITIEEISKSDLNAFELGRTIFMDYFRDLYKDMLPSAIGIDCETKIYLNSIFEKTRNALINDPLLHGCFARINNQHAGFAVFGPLENRKLILLRTLPIVLTFKNQEKEIRSAFMNHIKHTFPNVQNVVIMVRKANKVHNFLCLQAGFEKTDVIFETSNYINQFYDYKFYNGYLYSFNTL